MSIFCAVPGCGMQSRRTRRTRRRRSRSRGWDGICEGKRGVGRGGEIGVELPQIDGVLRRPEVVIHGADKEVRAPRRRQVPTIEIGRQQTIADVLTRTGGGGGRQERDHHRARVAGDHLLTVDGVGADADKGPGELAGANVVGIRPNTVLGVIGEVGASRKRVAVVGPERIGRGRDGDTVVVGRPTR